MVRFKTLFKDKSYLKHTVKYEMDNNEKNWQERKNSDINIGKNWIVRHFWQDFCQIFLFCESDVLFVKAYLCFETQKQWDINVLAFADEHSVWWTRHNRIF